MTSSRGFVNSLTAIMLTAVLMELFFFFQASSESVMRAQQSISAIRYADYYFDDIAYDITHLTADNPSLYRVNSTYVGIIFTTRDDVPDFVALVGNYTRKLPLAARKWNVNLTINSSNVTSNGMVYYFSNGVAFTPGYGQQNKSSLQSSSSATFKNVSITLAFSLPRNSLNDFNYQPSGDLYVRLNVTDLNGTYYSEGFLNSAQSNVMQANFGSDGHFEAHVQGNSFYVIKNNVQGTVLTVDTVMQNNGTYPVYISVPIYVDIEGPGYSKHGMLAPLGV